MVNIQRRDPQSLNRCAFVLNNPVRNIDPTGLQSEEENELQGSLDPEAALVGYLKTDQPNWFDDAWQQEFRAANGWAPTTADYWDRYVSMAEASGMGDDAGLTAQVQTVLYGGPPQPDAPEFYALAVTVGPVAVEITVDEFDQWYVGGGWNISSPIPSVSLTPGWLLQPQPQSRSEREEALEAFLTGWSTSYGGGFGPGASLTVSNAAPTANNVALQLGFYTPQAGIQGIHSWQVVRR